MPLFIKKPIQIEAIQLTMDTALDLQNSGDGLLNFVENDGAPYMQILGAVHIERAELGEWILKDPVSGNFYPVTDMTFRETYDEVVEEGGPDPASAPEPDGTATTDPAAPAPAATRKGKNAAPVADTSTGA